MAETVPIARPTLRGSSPPARERLIRATLSAACLAFFVGNIVAIVWIWVANDNLDFTFAPSLTSAVLARFGALAGLLGAYLALMAFYGLGNIANDFWLEQVVKRGWTLWQVPDVTTPKASVAWLLIVIAAAITWTVLVLPALRQSRRRGQDARSSTATS